jgi:NCS1 family nucleobase:cation symporter-1
LHAAQGAQLGVPQMQQTRGQFGSMGSLLVIFIVILMYVGFFASIVVVAQQALKSAIPALDPKTTILALSLLGFVVCAIGHDLIHAYAKVITYVCGFGILAAFIWIGATNGLPDALVSKNGFSMHGFIGAISTAALWQVAYAPYVSDYSRYMPEDTGPKAAFWACFCGSSFGAVIAMVLGAYIGLTSFGADIYGAFMHYLGSFGVAFIVVATIATIAAAAMQIYCATLSSITVGQTVFEHWRPGARSRIAISALLSAASVYLALIAEADFMTNFTSLLFLLLYVLTPWTSINLVDYYLVHRGRYDVSAFYRRDGGVYGYFNWSAIACYCLGILVQVPFISNPLYTGPVARMLGGADVSWIAGAAITSVCYYWLVKGRHQPVPGAARVMEA